MKIEMPNICVVTAIANAEIEDYYAQLLFAQGWNINFRALDCESLVNYLDCNPGAALLLIYSGDTITKAIAEEYALRYPTIKAFQIDDLPKNREMILKTLRIFWQSDSPIPKTAGRPALIRNQGYLPNHSYQDRKSTRLNSSHTDISRMPSSA